MKIITILKSILTRLLAGWTLYLIFFALAFGLRRIGILWDLVNSKIPEGFEGEVLVLKIIFLCLILPYLLSFIAAMEWVRIINLLVYKMCKRLNAKNLENSFINYLLPHWPKK